MSSQPAYPQQHEPWRPDYPPVWCLNTKLLGVVDCSEPPKDRSIRAINIAAFNATLNAIDKAMKQ